MYDSRSSHPFRGVHGPRSWREMGEGDRIEWGTPRQRILATPRMERLAIEEGVEDYLTPEGVGFGAECMDQFEGLKRLGAGRERERTSWSFGSWSTPTTTTNRTTNRKERKMNSTSRLAARSTTGRGTESRLSGLLADVRPDSPARIRKPRVAKRAFSRLTAPEFDPTKVSATLSPQR